MLCVSQPHFQRPRLCVSARWWVGVLFSVGYFTATSQGSPVDLGASANSVEEADLMLERGDSLLALNKPVAALSMFRGAEERTFDPCQQARARIGIAQIYAASDNPDLALESLESAQLGFLACDAHIRISAVLVAADLWLHLHFEDRAIDLVQRELELNPASSPLQAKLADLWYTGGHWEKARIQYEQCLQNAASTSTEQRADWLSALIQIAAVSGQSPADSLRVRFEEEAAGLATPDAQAYREQVHLVLSMQGMHMHALQWAETILSHTSNEDNSGATVAHLRVANSAQFAHRPLDALIGYHEAIKAARRTGDPTLLAESLRQKGLFEKERGNQGEALAAFIELDEIHTALLASAPDRSPRETRQFEEQVLPALDPFDLAALEMQQAQHQPYRSSSWPWIAGILAIGIIAYARQQRYLQSALHKERRRIIRLRSLVPADRLPQNAAKAAPAMGPELGGSSLMPNGELIHTSDEDARSQSIQDFLNELDADLQHRIRFNLESDVQFSIGPEVRVVIRNLLRGLADLSSEERPIELGVEASEKSHWVLRLNSQHTGASKAFEGLFYGKDALASSRWNELHAQLRKLAGKINIERLSPLEERVTLTLPYV